MNDHPQHVPERPYPISDADFAQARQLRSRLAVDYADAGHDVTVWTARRPGASGSTVRYRRAFLLLTLAPSIGGGDMERFAAYGEPCRVIAIRWSLPDRGGASAGVSGRSDRLGYTILRPVRNGVEVNKGPRIPISHTR